MSARLHTDAEWPPYTWWQQVLRWGLSGLLILLVSVFSLGISLNIPIIQTQVVKKVAEELSHRLQYPITLRYVSLSWFNTLTLRGVNIQDDHQGDLIYVDRLRLGFSLSALLGGKLEIKTVILEQPEVRLTTYPDTRELNINGFIAAIDRLSGPSNPNDTTLAPPLVFREVELIDGHFIYDDQLQDSLRGQRFDYYHFEVDSIQGLVSNLYIREDTIAMGIQRLSAWAPEAGLRVHEMRSHLHMDSNELSLNHLYTRVNTSVLQDHLSFHFADWAEFSDFNNRVSLKAHLKDVGVELDDIEAFAPQLAGMHDRLRGDGNVEGPISKLHVKQADLRFGQGSRLEGSVTLEGLPNWDSTTLYAKFRPSEVRARDLVTYIGPQAAEYVERMGPSLAFKGLFAGTPSDFSVQGEFIGEAGRLQPDFHLTLGSGKRLPTYEGKVTTQKLDLGRLSGLSQQVGLVDMEGSFEGRGFELETAELNLDARINRLGLNGYNYLNINTHGSLGDRQFNGHLGVRDSNLSLLGDVKLDLRPGQDIVRIDALVNRSNPAKLNIHPRVQSFAGVVDIDFKGLDIDNLVGRGSISRGHITIDNQRLALNQVFVSSQEDERGRDFVLQSDYADFRAHGPFKFRTFAFDMERLAREYGLVFRNNLAETQAYYRNKKNGVHLNYQIEFEFHNKNLDAITHILVPELRLSRRLEAQGYFESNSSAILALEAQADSVRYGAYSFTGVNLEFNNAKLVDSTDIVASLYLNSRQQTLGGLKTEGLKIDGVWNNQHVDFIAQLREQNSTNAVKVQTGLDFSGDVVRIDINPKSELYLIDQRWQVSRENSITLLPDFKLLVHNLGFYSGEQQVRFNGAISGQASDSLNILVKNFDLNTLKALTGADLKGIVNGDMTLASIYEQARVAGEVEATGLAYEGFAIGDLKGASAWDFASRSLQVNARLSRAGRPALLLEGSIVPDDLSNQLRLTATLDKTQINLLEPFTRSFIDTWAGDCSGVLFVSGKLKAPVLTGDIRVSEGQFRLKMMNTLYRFSHTLHLEDGVIDFSNAQLRDVNGSVGLVKVGKVFHQDWDRWGMKMVGQVSNFQIMNTGPKDNLLYYGTANVTGNATLSGPFDNFVIKADLRSEKGTHIVIPVSNYIGQTEELGGQKHILFTDSKHPAQAAKTDSVTEAVDLSGVTMDLNLEITNEASGEILLNEAKGEAIRGVGNGKLKMTLDTRSDFNMIGQYAFESGSYNFNFLNLQKNFRILKGSTITWSGDVLTGEMAVNATYDLNASLVPLVNLADEEFLNRPDVRRSYPVSVSAYMTGPIMKPNTLLGLKIKEYPQILASYVASFEARIKANEVELNNQVFSLIVARRFTGENAQSGSLVAGGGLSSLAEMLSSQVGAYFSSLDPNLSLDIDVNNLDQAAINALNVRLSYAFLEGRLRVTRAGGLTNAANQTTASSIAGDWTVEYLLSEDGIFRVKMFYKNNVNFINTGLNTQTNTSSGFTLMHTQSFNKLKELFKRQRDGEMPQDDELGIPPVGPFLKPQEGGTDRSKTSAPTSGR